MSAVPFSPLRVALIAQNTLREALRQKLPLFFAALALAFVLGARWLGDFSFGVSELKFLADCGFGAMAFFGAALAIVATAQLFFGELENRTALTLLAKPVWRAEFVLGKFIGVVALVAMFCALLTAVLVAVLWVREREIVQGLAQMPSPGSGVHYTNLVVAGGLQWLKLTVLAALVLLVASFAQTQLFTVCLGFLLWVSCHLQHLAQEALDRGTTAARSIGAFLAGMLPDFQLFTLADSLVAADAPAWMAVGRLAVYALLYASAACGLAVFSFRQREI